jgi:hypothetical protein
VRAGGRDFGKPSLSVGRLGLTDLKIGHYKKDYNDENCGR